MNFQTRIKHINKRLAKYSRILFVVLSVVGILTSFVLSGVSNYKFTKADTLVGEIVSGLFTNGVRNVFTLKDGSERMVTITNQWSSSTVQINSHYDSSDYNQFAVCETGVDWNETYESITSDIYGNVYIVDPLNEELLIFYFDDCNPDIYALNNITISDEYISGIVYDEVSGDIYISQDTRLVRLPSSDYAEAETYTYVGGYNYPSDLTINPDLNYIYVAFDVGFIMEFQIDNSFNQVGYDVSLSGIDCPERIMYSGGDVFVSDYCTDSVYQLSNFFLEDTYAFDEYIVDFTVNDDYVYISSSYYVTKFDIGNPSSFTVSDYESDVSFVDIDYIGNNIMNLTFWYREVYEFTLTVSGGNGSCPPATPEYIENGALCERFIYSQTEFNSSSNGYVSNLSLMVNDTIVILQNRGQYSAGLWVNFMGYFPFPSNFHYPSNIRTDSAEEGVYILFQEDSNNSDEPALVYFDFNSGTYSNSWSFVSGQELPSNFVIDSNDNIISINHDYPNFTSLTFFPSGDYDNPYIIDPGFDFYTYDYISLEIDDYDNLYAVVEDDLRIIANNSYNYDSSVYLDLAPFETAIARDIAIKTLPGNLVDIYIAGANAIANSNVVKLEGLDINGNVNGSQNFLSGYGNYSSYAFTALHVDDNGNIFAIPESYTDSFAWFTPDGTEHEFVLEDVSGNVKDVSADSSGNLYITSEDINFQLYDYDFIASSGGGDICSTATPPYIQNYTRCERYVASPSNDDITYDLFDNFNETVIDNDIFFASTDNARIYVEGNYYSLPGNLSGIANLRADPSSTDGVYFLSVDTSSYSKIVHFDYSTLSFDYEYDISTTSTTLDFDIKSNGNIYVLDHASGFTSLYEFVPGSYSDPNVININYNLNGYCTPRINISDVNDMFILCGNYLYGLEASDYENLSFTNSLSSLDINEYSTSTNFVIQERANDNVDVYISTINNSYNGFIARFEDLSNTGSYADDDILTDSYFNYNGVESIFVGNNNSVFAVGQNNTTDMLRFLPNGEVETITFDSYGNVTDLVLDSNYGLYVTSQQYAYQYFAFDFEEPSFAGTTSCFTGGDLSTNNIIAGNTIHTNAWVDGDPDPSGYIEIRANGLPIDQAPLDGVANSSYDFTILTEGTFTITLFYPGDDNYASCSEHIGVVEVESSYTTLIESQTFLMSIDPVNQRQITGEDITITVHVADPNNNLVFPTGDVELRHDICCSGDYNILSTGTLDSNGDVTFVLNDITPGWYLIYARYLGDSSYGPSSSSSSALNIYSIQTFTTLQSSDLEVVKGDSFTLTAHVTLPNFTPSVTSPVELSGWVRFVIGTQEIGWDQVDTNGYAEIVVNTSDDPIQAFNVNEGVHHIRAHYAPRHDSINFWHRQSTSETIFQVVTETDNSGGGSSSGSDLPPSGGEGGASDFTATVKGKDKVTGSLTETKIGSILSWVMSHNNLGPNSNQAVTYFPIRENQDFIVGSVVAPAGWEITYTQDQSCDDSTFNYTPSGSNGDTDTLVRCIRFENERVNVPPTRSDIRYINTSANFTELNVAALGGIDVYKVVPYNNKLFYFNHHWLVDRTMLDPIKTMFCFDLEINDTCVSENPNIVYPVVMGQDGILDVDDEYVSSKTSFAVNAEIVNDKMYIPMTDVNYNDGFDGGHGFLCWDLLLDDYCSDSAFKTGFIALDNNAYNAWGWGNIGDIEYNSDMQELYSANVSNNNGYMQLLCFSTATNAPCVGQPYLLGTIQAYDQGWSITKYHQSKGRIYVSGGANSSAFDRDIQCLIASDKSICPDFPPEGVQILPNKSNQSVFINQNNDQMCAFLYSDGAITDQTPPRIYCYNDQTETFYDYLPAMATSHLANDMYHDFEGPYPDGRIYYMAKWDDTVIACYDVNTGDECEGWEGGKVANAPFDDKIYTFREAFGCMWGASDSGRVFTFDEDGEPCNPLITLTEGNVAVTMDGNDMFCDTVPDDISWNKVKVLDSGTSPSPALLNTRVYDSTQCTTDENNIVTCTGSPLKSGNLLLNSGHELDISDISYSDHRSLTAILEFQYPSVPSPAPGFYIELNPTNKAQMCAETKLVFSGALCANPITTVCETTNISYINDPVSNNNGGQYCLNVETYFGKDPNSALCFVAATPEQRIFTVFNPNATVAPGGTPVDFNPEDTYNRGPGSYSFGNGFFGFFQNIIETTIPQLITRETVTNAFESVNTQTPLAVTAVTAVTTATVVATSVLAAGSGVGQIFGIFLGFFVPKKRKYWGVIYDDFTNKPVAFASITLSYKEIGTDNETKTTVIAQAVSDLEGRYRLNTDKRDNFYLEVKASGYVPYTKFITMANPLNSAEDIVYDIPLKRLDARSNMFKNLFSYGKKSLINFARTILLIASIVGFMFTIYAQINFPDTLNIILLGLYIVIFIISFYPSIYNRIKKKGKVLDVDFNSPIPGAVVRIYDSKQQLALSLTNTKGEARFDLPSGEYSILASKRGYIMVVSEGQQLIKAVLKTEGYLDRNILLKRIEEAPSQPSTGLDNPFA